MTTWNGYLAIDRQTLSNGNWASLRAAYESYGPGTDPQPANICHWRTSLDGDTVIYEAAFNDVNLSVAKFKQILGNEFSIDPADIGDVRNDVTFVTRNTPFWAFSYPDGVTNRFRAGIFGGLGSTWEESRVEVLGYIAANYGNWEEE
jgi:hypothetical protein